MDVPSPLALSPPAPKKAENVEALMDDRTSDRRNPGPRITMWKKLPPLRKSPIGCIHEPTASGLSH